MAIPGSTPWASASPRKLIPRSTTQVPTSDVHSAVSSTAHSVVRMNSLSVNGATHHAHGSVRNVTETPCTRAQRRGASPASVAERPGGAASNWRGQYVAWPGNAVNGHAERVCDRRGVEAHQVGIGLGAGPLLAERVRVQRDDIHAETIGEGRRVVRGLQFFGEDRRHSPRLDVVRQLLELGGGGLRQRRRPGKDRAEDLEVVAIGEPSEGVVVGHEEAAIRRDGGQDVGHLGVELVELGAERVETLLARALVSAGADELAGDHRRCVGHHGRVEPQVRVLAGVDLVEHTTTR